MSSLPYSLSRESANATSWFDLREMPQCACKVQVYNNGVFAIVARKNRVGFLAPNGRYYLSSTLSHSLVQTGYAHRNTETIIAGEQTTINEQWAAINSTIYRDSFSCDPESGLVTCQTTGVRMASETGTKSGTYSGSYSVRLRVNRYSTGPGALFPLWGAPTGSSGGNPPHYYFWPSVANGELWYAAGQPPTQTFTEATSITKSASGSASQSGSGWGYGGNHNYVESTNFSGEYSWEMHEAALDALYQAAKDRLPADWVMRNLPEYGFPRCLEAYQAGPMGAAASLGAAVSWGRALQREKREAQERLNSEQQWFSANQGSLSAGARLEAEAKIALLQHALTLANEAAADVPFPEQYQQVQHEQAATGWWRNSEAMSKIRFKITNAVGPNNNSGQPVAEAFVEGGFKKGAVVIPRHFIPRPKGSPQSTNAFWNYAQFPVTWEYQYQLVRTDGEGVTVSDGRLTVTKSDNSFLAGSWLQFIDFPRFVIDPPKFRGLVLLEGPKMVSKPDYWEPWQNLRDSSRGLIGGFRAYANRKLGFPAYSCEPNEGDILPIYKREEYRSPELEGRHYFEIVTEELENDYGGMFDAETYWEYQWEFPEDWEDYDPNVGPVPSPQARLDQLNLAYRFGYAHFHHALANPGKIESPTRRVYGTYPAKQTIVELSEPWNHNEFVSSLRTYVEADWNLDREQMPPEPVGMWVIWRGYLPWGANLLSCHGRIYIVARSRFFGHFRLPDSAGHRVDPLTVRWKWKRYRTTSTSKKPEVIEQSENVTYAAAEERPDGTFSTYGVSGWSSVDTPPPRDLPIPPDGESIWLTVPEGASKWFWDFYPSARPLCEGASPTPLAGRRSLGRGHYSIIGKPRYETFTPRRDGASRPVGDGSVTPGSLGWGKDGTTSATQPAASSSGQKNAALDVPWPQATGVLVVGAIGAIFGGLGAAVRTAYGAGSSIGSAVGATNSATRSAVSAPNNGRATFQATTATRSAASSATSTTYSATNAIRNSSGSTYSAISRPIQQQRVSTDAHEQRVFDQYEQRLRDLFYVPDPSRS